MSKSRAHEILSTLRQQLRTHGLLEPDGAGSRWRVLLWTPLLWGLLWFAWTSSSTALVAAAALCASILMGQFAFIGHDASHGTAARSTRLNALTGHWCLGVIDGLCFKEWQHRHLLHHKHCQDEAHDPDMQFATLFSLSSDSVAAKGKWGQRLAPYQAYYFWPTTLLFVFSLRTLALLEALSKPSKYRADLISIAGHFVFWFVAPALLLGADPLRLAVVYLAISSLLGVRLATVFTVNHVGMPATSPDACYFERQVVGSRNVDNPWWIDWYFGGLNFQIEHHLVPGCPRGYLRRAQALIRPSIEVAQLPYQRSSWVRAVADVTAHFNRVGGARPGPAPAMERGAAAPLSPGRKLDERLDTVRTMRDGDPYASGT